jgi:hypothetical protein
MFIKDLRQICSLPDVSINLMLGKTAQNDPFFGKIVRDFYRESRSRHPKFPLIRRFRHGVATCVLPATFDAYFGKIEASARRNFKKAQRNRYVFKRISFNDHLEEIAEIRQSAAIRQGKMPDEYLNEKPRLCTNPESQTPFHDYPYFGVLRDGKVYAYAGCLLAGELCLVEHIFGHAQHQSDGVVPMLLISIVDHLLRKHPNVKYYAYDTYFGAGETMRRFKTKLGFLPFRVTWKLDEES